MKRSISVTSYSWEDGPRHTAAHLRELATLADEAGLDTLWVPDHLLQVDPSASLDEPMLEAYTALGAQKALISPRSFTITTFALCGFANLSSIGIQIGGIGALIPERRNDLARLGFRAMVAGTLANLMSAAIVSMLIK